MRIDSLKHLAYSLDLSLPFLEDVAEHQSEYYNTFDKWIGKRERHLFNP